MKAFIKLNRTEKANDLLELHPNAFLLLTLIALRARREPNLIRGLDICECHLGDYEACGLTRQKYRTAIKVLEDLKLASFCKTNKGTIGKLLNSDIYDINICPINQQDNQQSNQQDNQRATTNKNVKKENNVNNTPDDFERFWNMYDKKDDRKKCLSKWKKIKAEDKELIFKTLPGYIASTPDKQFRKAPATYLNNESWKNESLNSKDNGQPDWMVAF